MTFFHGEGRVEKEDGAGGKYCRCAPTRYPNPATAPASIRHKMETVGRLARHQDTDRPSKSGLVNMSFQILRYCTLCKNVLAPLMIVRTASPAQNTINMQGRSTTPLRLVCAAFALAVRAT